MNLGEKIYNLRKKKGYSQESLASMMNVSRQAISKWEINESLPDMENLKKLADIFEISIDDLLEHPIKKTHKSTFDLKNILASTLLSVLCMSILLPFFMPKQVQIDWSQIDNLVEYANISRESGKFKINIITKVNMENAEVYALVNDERVEVEKTNQGYSFTYIFDQDLHRLDDGYIICLAYKIEDIEIKDAVLKITDIRYNGYSWEKLYLKNNYQ